MDIIFERAVADDASVVLETQKICFNECLQRYQDHDFNPCCEPIESILERINNQFFYKILAGSKLVGAVLVHPLEQADRFKLHTIFVLPDYRDKGIGQKAIEFIEAKHSEAKTWVLETPHDQYRNHHLYEKAGYVRTGVEEIINERLTLIHYKKEIK